MHRIDTPNRSPDLFGPGKDGFRDGNKTAGTNATEFTAAWCNDQQENIAQVIEGAGFALVKGDGTQLRQAITKMVQSAQRAVIIDAATFAGAVVGTGKAVYWDAANNRFDLAVADGSVKQSMVGFADVPAAKVYCFGAAPLFAGLLPGRYYLDPVTPGAITSAMPAANAVFVGVAKGATELFVDIDMQASASSGVQGAFRNLSGSATGVNAIVTYAIDELMLGDGAGNFQTIRGWAGSINMTALGANGIDVGAVGASTWYYAFGIAKPDGSKALIASLSPNAPSFANAAGYTKWARIGAFRTDGTANKYPLAFKQAGRKVQYLVSAGSNVVGLPKMANGSAGNVTTPSWVSVATGNFVPPTASEIDLTIGDPSGTSCVVMVAPNNGYGAYNSTTNPPPFGLSGIGGLTLSAARATIVLESSNIYWAANGPAGFLMCGGWTDNI